ncbi:MAG: winged helix-turn-helix domain-containing protein [Acidobacteriota bacterium]
MGREIGMIERRAHLDDIAAADVEAGKPADEREIRPPGTGVPVPGANYRERHDRDIARVTDVSRDRHRRPIAWRVYPVTARTSTSDPATNPQAILVAAVPTAARIHQLASELRRDFANLEIASADVLRAQAAIAVYVFCFDAAIGLVLATDIVTWAGKTARRAGLIGVIEDGSGDEREALLAAGFDDVVTGRISTRELAVRIRAVHRRLHWGGARDGRLRFAAFTLDLENHALWTDGVTIALTPVELEVMRELIKARGKPLSRVGLLDAAWGAGELDVSERAVDNVILRLRRKLPRPEAIETVRAVGFRLATG